MADNTKIEWADETINAINGCDPISPGCTNCYAMAAGRRNLPGHPSTGLTKPTKAGDHVWTGEVRLNEAQLLKPLSQRKPRRIFWNAHGDTFHEAVPDEWIDRQFAVMALTPHHTHMVLTKRSARMREYCSSLIGGWGEERLIDAIESMDGFKNNGGGEYGKPLPNVWLGVSVEDQARADERIPDLLATPAAIRFISAEPLLGPVDLDEWLICPNARDGLSMDPSTGAYECCTRCDWTGLQFGIAWVIAGGESGPNARPMHPDWARSLRDQCAAAGVAFHFKQWGEWAQPSQQLANGEICCCGSPNSPPQRVGKARAGRLLDGRTHDEFPA